MDAQKYIKNPYTPIKKCRKKKKEYKKYNNNRKKRGAQEKNTQINFAVQVNLPG